MKTIALVAHDGKKADMVAWATYNRDTLAHYQLVATESTARMLRNKVGLQVEAVQPGPLGGDAQIGARVVEGRIDGVVFLVDPLDKHPHDPDIQMLQRLCNVHNVPLATNVATADSIMVWLSLREPEELLVPVM